MGTRRAIRTVSNLALGGVLAASLGLLAAAVAVPRLAGATPYTVLTGSMRPTYPPGSLVVVRPVRVDDLRPGHVITYQLRSGEPDVVTHRVVGVDAEDGEVRVRTRGDANDAPDPTAVRPEQIRGRVWYAVPYVGHLAQATDDRVRVTAARLIGALLVAYAAYLLAAPLWRSRTRRAGSADS